LTTILLIAHTARVPGSLEPIENRGDGRSREPGQLCQAAGGHPSLVLDDVQALSYEMIVRAADDRSNQTEARSSPAREPMSSGPSACL